MPRFVAARMVHKAVDEWINDNQAKPIEPQAERDKENRAPAARGPATAKKAFRFACLRSRFRCRCVSVL